MSQNPKRYFEDAAKISLAKKRDRDRRAQQTQRNRRLGRVLELERRLADQGKLLQEFISTCEDLRRQNQILAGRLESVSAFCNAPQAWQTQPPLLGQGSIAALPSSLSPRCARDALSLPGMPSSPFLDEYLDQLISQVPLDSSSPSSRNPPSSSVTTTTLGDNDDASNAKNLSFASGQLGWNVFPHDPATIRSSLLLSTTSSVLVPPKIPIWALTPIHSTRGMPGLEIFSPWTLDFQSVLEAPDHPGPMDFLYGSRQNQLANRVHQRSRMLRCRKPETLAGGRLLYAVIKWANNPNESEFSALPDFLKPVPEQLLYPHPSEIDSIIWPKLRAALILKQDRYDLSAVLDSIACYTRLRWPSQKEIIERGENNNDFFISPDFYKSFTQLDAWRLNSDFVCLYPDLVEGLEATNICYEAD